MKNKAAKIVVLALVLVHIFGLSALAAGDYSIALDPATNNVRITGSGYDANSELSIMAAYNEAPTFLNLDYLNQITADENGNVDFSWISAATWKGGDTYNVLLNNVLKTATVPGSQSGLTSVTLTASTIVTGCAANIKAIVTGNLIDGKAVTIKLLPPSGSDALFTSEPVVAADGKAELKISLTAEQGALAVGTYKIVASVEDGNSISADLAVVNLPTNVWAPPVTFADGVASVAFPADIAPAGAYVVKVGSVEKAFTVDGNTIKVSGVAAGDVITIAKVKYTVLFPSYSFTFTVAVPA